MSKPFDEPNSADASTPGEELSSSATFDPTPLLHAFKQAWQSGNCVPIETVLTRLPAADPASESERRRLLVEMVKVDLEYRWRGASEEFDDDLPKRPLLEDYLNRFPALGPLDHLSVELIGAEYRVRRQWGDRPERDTYYARFPKHAELPSLLERIDAELAERADHRTLLTADMKGPAPVPGESAPDGYAILGELGRGGMGVVYKARQLRLNRLVAIKVIRSGEEAGQAALARFRTEAEAAARVQHPNVVQVYEVGDKNGQPFCVMEYVNGGSLAQRLAGAPLEPRVAARLMETLARAVQAIHDQSILHRDLKPSNILLHVSTSDQSSIPTSALLRSPACVPKIGDFGLAKPVESAGLTQTGAVLGTPSYMAPEQAESRTEAIGVAADVYGLGAILYEMLTGRPPFRGVTVLQTLEQVRSQEPLSPRQLQPAVPRDLETICLKCLQKDPAKRYENAAALADDLERFRQDLPIRARPSSRWERGLKWARRRPTLATLGAALVFGLVAAIAGGLTYTLQLRAAHSETDRQRQQADRSYNKAIEAVQQMLVRLGAERVEAIPGTEAVQVDALKDAIRLYQELQEEQEQPDSVLYTRLGFALTYLGNRQMALGQPEEAEKTCRRGMEVLDNLPPDLRDTPSCHHQSAFARYILGNILSAKNERVDAERLFLEACDILTSLGDDPAERELRTYCYTGLGQLKQIPMRRRDYYRMAVEEGEILHKDHPDSASYRNLLGQCLYNLGHHHLFDGEAVESEKLFQRCTGLLEPFAERGHGANDHLSQRVIEQNILFHCYSGLGILWSNRGEWDKGELFHLKAIALGEKLAVLYPHPPQRSDLSQCYVTLGGVYAGRQKREKATQMYRRGIAIQEALVRELPSISFYRVKLAESLGNLSLVDSDVDESFAVLQKGRDLLEPLVREHPNDTTYAADYGNLFTNEGLIYYHRGELRKALSWYDRAVEILTTAHRRNPQDMICLDRCGSALGNRAMTRNALQEHREALIDWDRLIEIVGPELGDKYRFHRIMTLTQLGEHGRAAEDIRRLLHTAASPQKQRYLCVCVLSHLVEAAENDPQLTKEERARASESYTACALEALTQLRRDGYFRNLTIWLELVTEKDMTALRERPEFKRWLRKQVGW